MTQQSLPLIFSVSFLCVSFALVGPTEAQTDDTPVSQTDTGAESESEAVEASDHELVNGTSFWDTMIVSAAIGSIPGVAYSYCEQRSRLHGGLGGGAGLAMFVLLGMTYTGPDRGHPVNRDLGALEKNLRSLGEVHLFLRPDEQLVARIVEIQGESVGIETARGKRSIRADDILSIEKRGDPSWDTPMFGAAIGAGLGVLSANLCSDSDLVPRAPRAEMAAWGAGILGSTALALDLIRKRKEVIYRARGVSAAEPRSFVAGPVFLKDGLGARMTIRF